MNRLVRAYLRRWDREVDRIRNHAPDLQKAVLAKVLASPLISYFHGSLDVKQFNDHELTTYQDYTSKVSALQNDKSQVCKYYARSSGTTSGQKKLIPTPEQFVRQSHLRGSWYILQTLYAHNPKAAVFRSKNLLVGGSIYDRSSDYLVGDVSGIMLQRIPKYMHPWYVPTIEIATMADWDQKLKLTAEAAAQTRSVTLLGGIPTWLLSIIKDVLDKTEHEFLSDHWPGLQAYIHGGVNMDPYCGQFEDLIRLPDFRYIEVYNASEGFFAFQDRPDDEGMLLMCAAGVYYEFISESDYRLGQEKVISLDQVVIGRRYVILITTLSGLLRYVVGDVVTFVTAAPYRIKVSGRINGYVNAFGEDVVQSQVSTALQLVCSRHGVSIIDYTVAPRYITLQEKGRHDWYIEFLVEPSDLEFFAKELDMAMRQQNANYDQKRINDLALESLKVHRLIRGDVQCYFAQRGDTNAQSKLPKLCNDRSVADVFDQILDNQRRDYSEALSSSHHGDAPRYF
ncbi:MAG: GH3 auxin-responsive promoter family protein [Bacteroidota bacterium]